MAQDVQCQVGGEAERSSPLSPFLLTCELYSDDNCCRLSCQTMAFPQLHKACAKEKGEARGCLDAPDTHPSENIKY